MSKKNRCNFCRKKFDTKNGLKIHQRQWCKKAKEERLRRSAHDDSPVPPNLSLTVIERKEKLDRLMEFCDGDEDRALFFLEWMMNGRNAKMAYMSIKPDVSERTAEVMGSRWLSEVEKTAIMAAYGVGVDKYFDTLAGGLEATRLHGSDAIEHPDWNARRKFHQAQGEILGIERKSDVTVNQQFNFSMLSEAIAKDRQARGLDV